MTDESTEPTTKDELYERLIEVLEIQIEDLKNERNSWKATAINNMHTLRDVYSKPPTTPTGDENA